jgi:hypothetical protein
MVTETIAKLPILQQGFRFTVPGRLCPNNVYTKPWARAKNAGRGVRNNQASRDLALIAELAGHAADAAVWRTIGEGEAVALTFILRNQLGDIDARPKVLLDGLQTIVYDNDKRVERLHLEVEYDLGEPRVDVIVEHVEPKVRHMRFEDLGPVDWATIKSGDKNAVLDPRPGVVLPTPLPLLPKSWTLLARKALKAERTCQRT